MIFLLSIIGCGGKAMVEIGFNDEGAVSMPGDVVIWLTKIELPVGSTLWRGYQPITIPINATGFISATGTYYEIEPGYYQIISVFIDSVRYVADSVSTLLVDRPYQFFADATIPIYIDENNELQLVVNIQSDNWLDFDAAEIKDGHYAFEGAQLKIHYQ